MDLCGPEMIASSFIILIHKLPHLQLRGPLGGTPRIDLIASQASHFALYFFLGLRFSGVDAEYRYVRILAAQPGTSVPNTSHQTNLSCRVLCHSKLVLLDVYQRFHVMLQWCNCGNLMSSLWKVTKSWCWCQVVSNLFPCH